MNSNQEFNNNAAARVNRGDDSSNGIVGKLLGHGRENAKTRNEIMAQAGICNDREFFLIIHNERAAGIPILADHSGYFLPSDDAGQARREMQAFKDRQLKTAWSTLSILHCINKALREMPGQETIDSIQQEQ